MQPIDWQQDPAHKRCYRALPGGPKSDFRLSVSKSSEYRWDDWMPSRQSVRWFCIGFVVGCIVTQAITGNVSISVTGPLTGEDDPSDIVTTPTQIGDTLNWTRDFPTETTTD